MSSPSNRRAIFDQVAHDYDAIRPGYPTQLTADIESLAALQPRARILEIGCGTGQATIPFAARGYEMVCLDIGEQLSAIARNKCRWYPRVTVHTTAFEDWQPDGRQFDLVISATAFHWIQPEIGYPKTAALLKSSGYLAIFANEHPTPFTGFAQAAQEIYRRVVPEWREPNQKPTLEAAIAATAECINRTQLSDPVIVRTYPWSARYNREQYIKLLSTYSDHRGIDDERRLRLFSAIGDLIDRDWDGSINRQYVSVLYLAKQRGD